MNTPTIEVTCTAHDQNGNPIVGGRITARLDRTETYQGFVVPEKVEVITNDQGIAILNLWPNELGSAGSSYRIQAWNPDTGKKYLDAMAVVPNLHCKLEDIVALEPYPQDDYAAIALAGARAASVVSITKAQEASDSASIAVAAKATTESARDIAVLAKTDAIAARDESLLSKQAAENSAALAGTYLTSVQTSAVNAEGFAIRAERAANAASVSEANALVSETSASDSKTIATTQADLASASATSAAASAEIAKSKADDVTVSAANAKASELAATLASTTSIEAKDASIAAKVESIAARDQALINAQNTGYSGVTSTSSITIGTGLKTFAVANPKAYLVTNDVRVVADASNYLTGVITAVQPLSITVDVKAFVGTGTKSSWTFSLNALFSQKDLVFFDAAAAVTIDYTKGNCQRWAPGTGTKTLSITNWPPAGSLGELLIEGINLGVATITWPTINWVKSDGTTVTTFSNNGVTLQTAGTDWVMLWTRDAGTTIYGKVVR